MNLDSLLDVIATITWGIVIVVIGYRFWRNWRRASLGVAFNRSLGFVSLGLLAIAIVVTFISAAVIFIEPQRRGVVVSSLWAGGVQPDAREPGISLIVPLAEDVYQYPIFWQTYTMSSSPLEGEQVGDDSIIARTNDGQEVRLDCSIIFRVDREQVVRVHIDWQSRYVNDLVRPRTRGIVRSIASQFNAIELNSASRSNLEQQINIELTNILEDQGLQLDAFVLRNVAFTPEFAEAVEQKQVAEQRVIEARLQAQQIEALALGRANEARTIAQGDADAARTRAQGQADALATVNSALAQDPQTLLTYEYIQRIAPNIRVLLVPNNAPLVLPLPPQELSGDNTTTAPGGQATGALSDTLQQVLNGVAPPTATPSATATPVPSATPTP